MANGVFHRIGGLILAALKPEKLDELPEPPADGARKPFLAWLLQAEELPLEEGPVGRATGSLTSRLFSAEDLPQDPPPPRGLRTPLFATLFSRERLEQDAVPVRPIGIRDRAGRKKAD